MDISKTSFVRLLMDSKRRLLFVIVFVRFLLHVMDVSKTSFVRLLMDVSMTSSVHYCCLFMMTFSRYGCQKDVFCTLWMSKRCLLYVMHAKKMSFVRYSCLKDVVFVRYESLEDVFCTLWMSKKTSFVRYELICFY